MAMCLIEMSIRPFLRSNLSLYKQLLVKSTMICVQIISNSFRSKTKLVNLISLRQFYRFVHRLLILKIDLSYYPIFSIHFQWQHDGLEHATWMMSLVIDSVHQSALWFLAKSKKRKLWLF